MLVLHQNLIELHIFLYDHVARKQIHNPRQSSRPITGYTTLASAPFLERFTRGIMSRIWVIWSNHSNLLGGLKINRKSGKLSREGFPDGVERNVEDGTKILFEEGTVEIAATGVDAPMDKEALYTLATNLTVHSDRTSRAKQHRRRKAQRHRKKLQREQNGSKVARAAMDYRIRPHHCAMVRLDGDFSEDPRRPCLAVSNTSDRPRMIHKGEVLGNLVTPEKFFDYPRLEEELEDFEKRTGVMRTIMNGRMTTAKTTSDDARNFDSTVKDMPVYLRTNERGGVPPDLTDIHIRDEKG
ncbi:hypothetical protein B0H17DRAFT_1123839 [Mycena rosella]|uniref:Uncharacterized protein n=1 Tax=Mycena rosella TaxID=1033263 RepID=A0AAD7H2M5_MYCRO|nr:hypothetical protein B0H17DRAFT_1123839 [Mycena rosella]